MIKTPEQLTTERNARHGAWSEQAECSQMLKAICRNRPNWRNLPAMQREALEMLMVKVSRVLHGDPTHVDHWADLEGYAYLGKPMGVSGALKHMEPKPDDPGADVLEALNKEIEKDLRKNLPDTKIVDKN